MTGAGVDTLIAQALSDLEEPSGAVVPAIQPATTFERGPDGELLGDYIYRRNDSPTVRAAETVLAKIDGGEDALLFNSGMAAVTAFFAAQPRGTRVVAPRVMYHGAQDWLRRLDSRGDITLTIFDRLDTEGLVEAVGGGADIAWIESPLNPTWEVIDIEAAANAAHAAGARLVVDSTVAPPVTTRPLDLGADVVFHSGSKYLNGHSDVTAGVLVTDLDDSGWQEVRSMRVSLGSAPSPFDAWLLLRGLRTLGVRYRRASESALRLAGHIESDDHIERVLYPGLPSHPQHDIAVRQMTGGFGGMISLLVDGSGDVCAEITAATDVFTTATSLGGTESLIEHRARVEGPNSIIPQNLLRLSVGLEDADDLITDLDKAIAKALEGVLR
ncbi:MAG: PLP-dependent transferase [Actinomycetota bacterium]|nr:PLP-dependent transferase [Actinomycetota bacterium]